MSRLVVCPECHRHARLEEEACPFCAAELPGEAGPPGAWTKKVARVGAMVAVIGGLGSCSTGTGAEPPYGAPPEPDVMPDDDGGTVDGG